MAEIIPIHQKTRNLDNLIIARPLEFRRGEWRSGHVMMVARRESERFEAHRLEALRAPGHKHLGFVPNHFALDGGYHYTIMALFRFREDEAGMRRVYRLAGMMECVTSSPSKVLRTDLLRRFYRSIMEERDELNIIWRGNVRHFLLPLDPQLHNPNLFHHAVERAESLKDLYDAIQSETDTQFDVLCRDYVIYIPEPPAPADES